MKKKIQLVQLQRLFKYRISKNFDIFQKRCTVIPTEAIYIRALQHFAGSNEMIYFKHLKLSRNVLNIQESAHCLHYPLMRMGPIMQHDTNPFHRG